MTRKKPPARRRNFPGGRDSRQVAFSLVCGLLLVSLACGMLFYACAALSHYGRGPAATDAIACGADSIVGAQGQDRAGDPPGGPTLADAVQVASGAPSAFASYADIRFLTAVTPGAELSRCFEQLGYRYSDGDRCSVEHLLTQLDRFGDGTLVLADAGGAHSIAMATELGARKGYQLVFKLGSRFDPQGVNRSEQDLAAFRYHFPVFSKLTPAKTAPAVFVLDAHRGETPLDDEPNIKDNSAPFTAAQFPAAGLLRAEGIKRVIWILEGKTDAAPVLIDAALEAAGVFRKYEAYVNNPLPLLLGYRDAGIEIYRFRINPYDCPYSRRHSP